MNEILLNRIMGLCNQKKINIANMLKSCNLPNSTIDNIKNGSKPSYDKIAKIADLFDVSIDYLLGRTDKPDITYKTSSGTRIVIEAMTPPNVEALQRVYACLDETGQEKVIAYAEDLIQSGKYKKTAVHLIAARGDGGIKELSEEEYKKLEKAIQDLPDANDLDYL